VRLPNDLGLRQWNFYTSIHSDGRRSGNGCAKWIDARDDGEARRS